MQFAQGSPPPQARWHPRYRARVPARGAGYLPWGLIDVPYPANRGSTCLSSAVEMGSVQLTELQTGTVRIRDNIRVQE